MSCACERHSSDEGPCTCFCGEHEHLKTELFKTGPTDYLAAVAEAQVEHPEWRAGQAAFNVLLELHPAIAEKVRGTDLDSFPSDTIEAEFLEFVNWELNLARVGQQ